MIVWFYIKKNGFVLYWKLRGRYCPFLPEEGRGGIRLFFFTTLGRGKNKKLNVITIVLTKKP